MCKELSTIKPHWRAFGMNLGVPKHKLDEYEDKKEPLFEVINYWDAGNIKDKPVMTWKAVADTLRCIEKPNLAKAIENSTASIKRYSKVSCNGYKAHDYWVPFTGSRLML